ncbi:MAG: hypothetical protein ACRDRK_08790, partial [Pseudonocardia sp.]
MSNRKRATIINNENKHCTREQTRIGAHADTHMRNALTQKHTNTHMRKHTHAEQRKQGVDDYATAQPLPNRRRRAHHAG